MSGKRADRHARHVSEHRLSSPTSLKCKAFRSSALSIEVSCCDNPFQRHTTVADRTVRKLTSMSTEKCSSSTVLQRTKLALYSACSSTSQALTVPANVCQRGRSRSRWQQADAVTLDDPKKKPGNEGTHDVSTIAIMQPQQSV